MVHRGAYTHTHTHTHTHRPPPTHTNTHTHTHTHTPTPIHTHIHSHENTTASMHKHPALLHRWEAALEGTSTHYACMSFQDTTVVTMKVLMHTHTQTHAHTCRHKHVHIHIHISTHLQHATYMLLDAHLVSGLETCNYYYCYCYNLHVTSPGTR